MQIRKSKIINSAILLAAIPTILFLLWYKLGIALVAALLLVISYIRICRRNNITNGNDCIYIEKWVLAIVMLWLMFISFFAGIGGMFPQTGDNIARNPIFYDLITKEWPVVYPEMDTGLTYYVGFWLLPAIIGKVFGNSIWIGNLALAVQSGVYLFAVALVIISWLDLKSWKKQILVSVILVVFSGLNYWGQMVCYMFDDERAVILGASQELYTSIPGAYYLGNFWAIRQTFNHFIPLMLIVCIYVYVRDIKICGFLTMLAMMISPFGTLGLGITAMIEALCLVVKTAKMKMDREKFEQLLREFFTVENIVSLIVAVLIMFYYIGREAVESIGKNSEWFISGNWANNIQCIAIIMAECGFLILLLYKSCKRESLFYISSCFLLLIPFWNHKEIVYKTTAVWLIILMLLYIRAYFEACSSKEIGTAILFSVYLALCLYNFSFETALVVRPIYKNKTKVIKKNQVESFEDYRMGDSFTYIANYIKRNPSADVFFEKLSRANYSEFDKLDIVVDTDGKNYKVSF